MVTFVGKRLQVFVSSTFEDLKAERQVAVEAILAAGHIPAGMELFAADNESQMTVIKQWIDESDAYVLILGGRYGSIEPKSGKSYTHLEYEYAVQKNKPICACVAEDCAIEKKVKKIGRSAMEQKAPDKLSSFREEVMNRMVAKWSDPRDIRIAIADALASLSRKSDLIGWVRPAIEPAGNPFGLISYNRDSHGLANKAALIREAKKEVFWIGASFHYTLPNCRQLIIDRVAAGLNFRALIADPAGLDYQSSARSFGQTRVELGLETERTMGACNGIRASLQTAMGSFSLRKIDYALPLGVYFFDPTLETGSMMLVPHIPGHDAPVDPGFLFRRTEPGPLVDYFEMYDQMWKHSTDAL
jgi:hypothetical protein